jgi:hypothetical protein
VNWIQGGAYGHNLIASHQSNTVLATWMTGSNDSMCLHYRVSDDAGSTWSPTAEMDPPDAFGGDTLSTCARGASGLFDRNDNWLIVTTVLPVVGDSALSNPAQLWLYNSGTSAWHRIHTAYAGALAGGFGSHAAICDRPGLGENPATGRLFVAWEQFDSANVEPSTNLLRADIWASESEDGTSWSEPTRITSPDESSKRFPSLARSCAGDSLAVFFVQDQIAGFNSDEVGAVSNNPVCIWRGSRAGIAGDTRQQLRALSASPNPGQTFRLYLSGPAPLNTSLEIRDVSGRAVRTIEVHGSEAIWDGTDQQGTRVSPGCYLARWQSGNAQTNTKLVVGRR